MSKQRGNLYVFEGPDGVGKSTLAAAFLKVCNEAKKKTVLMTFPGKREGSLGKCVYELHHSPKSFGVETIDPVSLQILHVAAHIDAIRKYILPSLRSGVHVILDRFWWSTWVYGLANGANPLVLKNLIDIEIQEWTDIRPTLAFLIQRKTPFRASPEHDKWTFLCNEYSQLCKSEAAEYPVHICSNELPVEQIAQELYKKLLPQLPNLQDSQ